MSYYGDENWKKNDLLDLMIEFLRENPVSELLTVVTDAVENIEAEKDNQFNTIRQNKAVKV